MNGSASRVVSNAVTRSRLGPAAVGLLLLAAAVAGALAEVKDLHVYRYGGRAVLERLALYEVDDPTTGLPFTYPPFAAVLFVPLALPPPWVVAGLWTAASVAALVGVVVLVRGALGRATPVWLAAMLGAGMLALEPVWQTLSFGQVNLLLMAGVLVDVLRPERRWSGVLVGLVAGLKLTPLVFVVLLVLVGHRGAAGRAALVFAGTVAAGQLVLPGASTSYWTDGLLRPGRVGPPALAHNQSVSGALTRLLDAPPPTLVWLAVAGPLALGVLALAAAAWRAGDRGLGSCVAAVAMLLASPVSWSHHWVWAVPMALVLWERSRWVAGAWAVVFVARPVLWPPWGAGREYAWAPWEHALGNAYLLAALAVVAWTAAPRAAARSGPPVDLEPGGRPPVTPAG